LANTTFEPSPTLLNALGKVIPIGDFVGCSLRAIRLRLQVARLSPPFQPQVDGIPTHLEDLSGFAFFHPI
jgi:hypothetical protein